MKRHAITFVDASGGGAAALAGGVARGLGLECTAATVSERVAVPKDVGECLAEIGMTPPDVSCFAGPGDGPIVFLGTPPPPFAAEHVWAVDFGAGPPRPKADYVDVLPENFERMASLRRARDGFERRIEQTFRLAKG